MRDAFCKAMVALGAEHPYAFLTGDLGFGALEPLQAALGGRFINAGVAEQNMVGVAAGLAAGGLQAWVYSIAPFIYARPFEQVRNDVCLQKRDVKLVGNGGGYGYGSMGGTHHALEDYGSLLTLQHMTAYLPAFSADVEVLVPLLGARPGPAYLRLGRDERPAALSVPAWAPWRRLLPGGGPVIVAVGPLAGALAGVLLALDPATRPQLWCLGQLPLGALPFELLEAIDAAGQLMVVEEHVATGGAGQALAAALLSLGRPPRRFIHAFAAGYASGAYGSQAYHRRDNGLDPQSLLTRLQAPRDEGKTP